jgi:hypothetical protein
MNDEGSVITCCGLRCESGLLIWPTTCLECDRTDVEQAVRSFQSIPLTAEMPTETQ